MEWVTLSNIHLPIYSWSKLITIFIGQGLWIILTSFSNNFTFLAQVNIPSIVNKCVLNCCSMQLYKTPQNYKKVIKNLVLDRGEIQHVQYKAGYTGYHISATKFSQFRRQLTSRGKHWRQRWRQKKSQAEKMTKTKRLNVASPRLLSHSTVPQ